MHGMQSLPRFSGFTLIEVLVALLILAIVATIAVSGLQAVVLTDRRQIQVTDQLAELQVAYVLLQRDVSQAINRPILDSKNEWRSGWLGIHGLGEPLVVDIPLAGESILEFTRGGVPNPQELLGRSTMQRITYAYDGKKLIRYEWTALDRTATSTPFFRTLLPDISELEFFYYDKYGQSSEQWVTPVPLMASWLNNLSRRDNLPAAVEIKFMHPHYGVVKWIFRVNEDPNAPA